MSKLFVRKPLLQLFEEAERNEYGLKRHLTALNLILLGVGCVIGAGIFVITGTASAMYAGPSLALSFILSAIGCAFAGLCYAEFASMIPISGSAYTYAYANDGRVYCLDYRLGFNSGISFRCSHGGCWDGVVM